MTPVAFNLSPRTGAILVTGATGRVGRRVVDELLRAGVPVRALTRRPEQAALPAGAEVVMGDLTAPDSLDTALHGAEAVFLVWTAALATAPAVVARPAAHTSGQPRPSSTSRRHTRRRTRSSNNRIRCAVFMLKLSDCSQPPA